MGREDWYRNTAWSQEIEAAFRARLARARDKRQRLRLQAHSLAEREPRVALRLLDEYFALAPAMDEAQAHMDAASAYRALGNIDAAIIAMEAALSRESARPSVITQAWLELPVLIVLQNKADLYERALELVDMPGRTPSFPVDHFRRHGVMALVAAGSGRREEATAEAETALAWADVRASAFGRHPGAGLVDGRQAALRGRLERLTQPPSARPPRPSLTSWLLKRR
jgi:hypothetical protein